MTWHLAVVTSRMLLMNAESLISLPDQQQLLHSHCRKPSCHDHMCQQALLSLKQEVLADKTSNLCIFGFDISTYNFKVASQLGHLKGHAYQGRRSNSTSSFAGTNNICVMDVWMLPKPAVSFLTRMHVFHKLRAQSSREVKLSSEKVGFKSAQCLW